MNSDLLKWLPGETKYYYVTSNGMYTMALNIVKGVEIYVLWRRENTIVGKYATPDEAAEAAQNDVDNIPM